jgi:hypothetical protein
MTANKGLIIWVSVGSREHNYIDTVLDLDNELGGSFLLKNGWGLKGLFGK